MQRVTPMDRMLNYARPFVAALALALGGAGCTAQAYCEKQRECAADPPGEDFVRVCATTYDGQVRAWRVNKEEECQLLADAKIRYDACTAALECRDFTDSEHNGECDQERDDYFDAFRDAENECGTLD